MQLESIDRLKNLDALNVGKRVWDKNVRLPGRMREAGDGDVSLVPSPGGHGLVCEAMLEVVMFVSSAPLTPCSALVQLGSCEAKYCLSINATSKCNSSIAAYHWMEESKTSIMVKSWSQTDHHSESCDILCIS